MLCTMVSIVMSVFGCAQADDSVLRMALGEKLREVSGLAWYENSVLAIADERARIYRVDFEQGRISKLRHFGEKSEKGDFEGLAVIGDQVYAITSDGLLYAGGVAEADNTFTRVDTGLGELCEIEGLAHRHDLLFVLCKEAHKKHLGQQLLIYAWNPVTQNRVPAADLVVPWSELVFEGKKYLPSALEYVQPAQADPHWLILAARNKGWLVLSEQGAVLRQGVLPNRQQHPQAEGVLVTQDYTFVADEGKQTGTLTRYQGSF